MSESMMANPALTGNYPRMPISSPYYSLSPEIRIPGEASSSSIGRSFTHDHPSVPSSSTLHIPSIHSLHSSYGENPVGCSPTDSGSPTGLHPNVPRSRGSTSPVTVLSPLDSESADSSLNEFYEAGSTSPAGSTVAYDPTSGASSASAAMALDSAANNSTFPRSRSVENTPHGHAGMGPVRRGNNASDRGKNSAATIRVHRPAGIKWNQRTR